jgi:hypothetical protein
MVCEGSSALRLAVVPALKSLRNNSVANQTTVTKMKQRKRRKDNKEQKRRKKRKEKKTNRPKSCVGPYLFSLKFPFCQANDLKKTHKGFVHDISLCLVVVAYLDWMMKKRMMKKKLKKRMMKRKKKKLYYC